MMTKQARIDGICRRLYNIQKARYEGLRTKAGEKIAKQETEMLKRELEELEGK